MIQEPLQAGIHPSASIDPSARLAPGVAIGERVVIGADVVLGQGVVVYPETEIGAGSIVFDNAVLGRPPLKPFARGRATPSTLRRLSIGANCVIGACAVIYRGTQIGDYALVGDGAGIREQVRIGRNVLIAMGVTINYGAEVRDRARIMDNSHVTGHCVIEEDVFVSTGVATTNDNAMAGADSAQQEFSPPRICRGASVAANVTLLPGVVVGEEALVGAGSVVTRDVEPGTTVIGIPARPRNTAPPGSP